MYQQLTTNRIFLFASLLSFLTGVTFAQVDRENQSRLDELESFRAAADADRNNLAAQLRYAQQLHHSGQSQKSWQRLLEAYQINSADRGVLMGMNAVLDAFKLEGKFNVGTPAKKIQDLLGPPQKTLPLAKSTRMVYGSMALDLRDDCVYEFIKLDGASDLLFQPQEIVQVELDETKWKVGMREKRDSSDSVFYFGDGESVASWHEMVVIERILNGSQIGVIGELIEKTRQQVKQFQENAQIQVLFEKPHEAILAVLFPASENRAGKQQIVRFWMGNRDVHRLAYVHQGAIPAQTEAEKWLNLISSAKLMTIGSKGELQPFQMAEQSSVKTQNVQQESNDHQHVRQIAQAIRNDLSKSTTWKPTESVLAAIAATESDQNLLNIYCHNVYQGLGRAGVAAKPDQTEIIVFGPKYVDLPGSYETTKDRFKPEVKFYGFRYVNPGEKFGMSYDGVFEVDGKFYFLPKAYRAFK